jgi:hypothetical protein
MLPHIHTKDKAIREFSLQIHFYSPKEQRNMRCYGSGLGLGWGKRGLLAQN